MIARLHVVFTGGPDVADTMATWLKGAGGGVEDIEHDGELVAWFTEELLARDAGMRLLGISPRVLSVRVEPVDHPPEK